MRLFHHMLDEHLRGNRDGECSVVRACTDLIIGMNDLLDPRN